MNGLTLSMNAMTLAGQRSAASLGSRSAVAERLCVAGATSSSGRPAVFVVEAKQNSKKRVRQAAKTRLYNKSHKTEISTRIKKVLVAAAGAKSGNADAKASLQTLLSEAYQVIDKAAGKGILKDNTAARRKAMIARAAQAASA